MAFYDVEVEFDPIVIEDIEADSEEEARAIACERACGYATIASLEVCEVE
jgi:hypothetical protein